MTEVTPTHYIHIGKGIVKPSLDNLEEQTRFQKKC